MAGSSRQVYSNCVQTRIEEDIGDRETVQEGGHYSGPIPRKQDKPCLPNINVVSLDRFHGLGKRLDKTETMVTYDGNISRLPDRGYAEKVPDEQFQLNDGSVWYNMPHHGVTGEAKACRTRAPPAALPVGCGWQRSARVTDGILAHSTISHIRDTASLIMLLRRHHRRARAASRTMWTRSWIGSCILYKSSNIGGYGRSRNARVYASVCGKYIM